MQKLIISLLLFLTDSSVLEFSYPNKHSGYVVCIESIYDFSVRFTDAASLFNQYTHPLPKTATPMPPKLEKEKKRKKEE